MIRELSVLDDIRKEWQGVRNRQASILVGLFMSSSGGGIFPHKLADISYSLVLIFAYSVLCSVLQQLRNEEYFTSPKKDGRLGTLMHKSKKELPWVSFDEVDRGYRRRNDVAHKDLVLPREEAWSYIDQVRLSGLDFD